MFGKQVELIFSDNDIITTQKNGLKKEIREIHLNDVLEIVKSGLVLTTGLMATGIKEYNLDKNGKEYITLELPPRIRKVSYRHSDNDEVGKYIVPFPGLVFVAVFENKKMYDCICVAIRKPLSQNSGKLFHFPFSNVNSDGRICWGDGVNKNRYSLLNVDSLARYFLESNFNQDLSDRRFISPSAKVKTMGDFFRYLDGLEKFPETTLKSFGTNYAQLLEGFK